MTFHELQAKLLENFNLKQTAYGNLFQTDADREKLWETYIESFPAKINPIYRKRREFDCSACRHFIKNIGGAVMIDAEMNIHTIWGFEVGDPDYQTVLDAMDHYVKGCTITDIYLTKETKIGTQTSYTMESGYPATYEHLWLPVPAISRYSGRDTIDTVKSRQRDLAMVFKRSLSEIDQDAIDAVQDLIASNTLYKGAEWKRALEELSKHKEAFAHLTEEKRNLYAWANAEKAGPVIGKIRNHSIGVLLTDISEGMDLDAAVTRYERIVAPANYKRPKAIFTKKMLESAQATISELGYMDSLQRRYARLDDITVNNILFANRNAAKRINGTVFDELMGDAKKKPMKFDRVEEIPIERFVSDVLPGAKEIEAYVENRHASNLVSLIAPCDKTAKTMFKWHNGFSWAYSGNITDSNIKENVKNAGGNVNGVLRFSIQWNDQGESSCNDLDAHCRLPSGEHIYFGHRHSASTNGALDVDIIHPKPGVPAVENITWPTRVNMFCGDYLFFVHQFCNRGGRDGFRAEIAFDGKTFKYDYRKELRQDEIVNVAVVTLNRDGTFSIEEQIPSTTSSAEIWGLKTMDFVPVSVIMLSPNYWDEQNGIGNKHYFFMLNGAVNPEKPNGFYNEYLKNELSEHKRVFEALGSKLSVAAADDQLSGLGFSSTLRNSLVVKVRGATERIMKITF